MVIDAINYENLSSLVTVSTGFPLRGAVGALKPGDSSIVQMRNVDVVDGINWKETEKVTLPTKRKPDWLRRGDIILAARGSNNFALSLNEVRQNAVCSPHFFVLRVKNSCDPIFLAWQINQRPAQEYFKRSATGSHVMNIRKEVVENLEIALPPIDQQRAIVEHFLAATTERNALKKLIKNRNSEIEAIALGLFRNKIKG